MALNSDIRDQAYQFFIEEAPELLNNIESGLLTLKAERTTAKVHEIMRAAHSLKGGAASVELNAIKTLAHRLEDVFKALYSETVVIDTQLESLLLQAYDCLKNPLMEQIEVGSFNAEEAIQLAEPIFGQIEMLLGDNLDRADQYIPTSSDLGIDIVSSIFEVDVAQGLERLTEVVAAPQSYEVVGELRAQAEVFVGFAELLGLPGFGEIAQLALQALDLHPESTLEIAQLAIADWQSGREQVLAGDRDRGGNPSAALSALANGTAKAIDVASIPLENSFDSTAIDWGTQSSSTLDDFFGTIEPTPEIATPAAETTPMDVSLPGLEEIFGTIEPTPEIATPAAETTPMDVSIPGLEEIFGAVEPTEPSPEIATPAAEITPMDVSIPGLEEIFGAVTPASNGAKASDHTAIPSVEDIFGEAVPPAESPLDATPSLEDIFGGAIPPVEAAPPTAKPTPPGQGQSAPIIKLQDLSQQIEAAIQSVEQIFDRLPSIEETPKSVSPLPPSTEPKTAPTPIDPPPNKQAESSNAAAAAKSAANLSVRVDFNRLERMNNLVGELSINRNSLSLQNEQIQDGVKELLNRFARFQAMTGKLRELSDQILVKPMNGELNRLKSEKDSTAISERNSDFRVQNLAEFDALEMDSYGVLYSQLQGLLEEMIQLEEAVEDIVLFARSSNQSLEQQRQMLTNLRDELMWARMLPLGEVLNRFPRVLRDLSATYHKFVRLKLSGTGVLVDKAALEKLYDPLLHLLRNAFDHGIEPPDARKQQGKPEEGQIEIKAYHQGNQTIIEIEDDGRGLNLEKIGQKAVNIGMITAEDLAAMDKNSIAELIFQPGFSTASQVSELSGRGVGLDVVRSQLQALKGTVSVSFTPGQGTKFILRLPLTLTISKLLVCLLSQDGSGQATAIAIPSDSIEEIIIPIAKQMKKSGSQRFLHWQGDIIPICRLNDLLSYHCALPEITSSKVLSSVPIPDDWALPLMLLRRGQQMFALEVNRLVSEQELVVKPFGSAIAAPSYTYGCTILGDGTLIPVINGAILLDRFLEPETNKLTTKAISSGESETVPTTVQATTVLVVDDSATLRRTLALTLQKVGYRVLQARDGREALEQLQQSAAIQLVICDVEMPNMNGFEFLGQHRRDPAINKIPVAMLTSRSSDKHRQLAMHLGASAYFTKPFIEQQFLSDIANLVAQKSPKALSTLS
jgi:two-component system, chemotaxis family, sensor histidine kinase and response regulator PixL